MDKATYLCKEFEHRTVELLSGFSTASMSFICLEQRFKVVLSNLNFGSTCRSASVMTRKVSQLRVFSICLRRAFGLV